MKIRIIYRALSSCQTLALAIIIFVAFTSCSSSTAESEDELDGESYNILKAAHVRPLTDVNYESTPARIERGKYLTEGPLWCFQCHTERDKEKPGWPPFWDKKGSGAELFKTDSTHLYAPNITPDKKTGVGNFTDDMIARAIREGVGHDGRALSRMPWSNFRELTDEDVASVVTYLRSLPPIENRIPRRKLLPIDEQSLDEGVLPLLRPLEELNLTDPITKGKYLIQAADCKGCHTGWYGRNPGVFGGGNQMGDNESISSPNISSDSTGVGAWPAETFIYVMRNGKGKSGVISQDMPWTSYKNMSDEDLTAIYLALMTTYPVNHIVQNKITPTYCEVCELKHGAGDQNKIRPLRKYQGNVTLPKNAAGTYVDQVFGEDTLRVIHEKNDLVLKRGKRRRWKLIPISSTQYFADGMPAPVQFIRDTKGNITELAINNLGRTFKKLERSN